MAPEYSGHPAMFRSNPVRFMVAVLLIPVFGVGLVLLVAWWLASVTTSLEIGDGRLSYTTGVFSKTRVTIEIDKVRSVGVHQSLFQRLMNVGDLQIFTAGDAPEITAHGFPDPERIRGVIVSGKAAPV